MPFWGDRPPAGPVSADELHRRAGSFTATRFREGYDQAEVDALVGRAVEALRDVEAGRVPRLGADEVLNTKFQATKFRDGYDQDEVDDLLDRVVDALRGGSSAGAAGGDGTGGVGGRDAEPITSAELRQAASSFRRTRIREGYDPAQVDALVAEVLPALDDVARGLRPRVSADRVLNAKFKATRFAPGYDQDEVDDLLERVIRTLRGGAAPHA